MKIVALISRYLPGLAFLVFGLNGFLNFIPQGPLPTGLAGQFLGALMSSHYMQAVSAVEVVVAVLFLVNRFVPLGLVLLAPILVNIILFHLCFFPGGIAPGTICVVLWLLLASRHRPAFAGLLRARA